MWYLWTDIFFWAITLWIIVKVWPKLDRWWRFGCVVTALIVMPLQAINEYLSFFVFKAWTLSVEYNKLLGWDIFGIPVEEYLFWFAFAWMLPFMYSGFILWLNEKGAKAEG